MIRVIPWQFYQVFGHEKVNKCLINGMSIDDIIYNEGKNIFSISDEVRPNGKKYRYLSENFSGTRFKDFKKISNKEAYDVFGIEGMEEAIEKTYSMIDVTQLVRDEKIDQIIS